MEKKETTLYRQCLLDSDLLYRGALYRLICYTEVPFKAGLTVYIFICYLDIFALISQSDIVRMPVAMNWLILKIIGQCDAKHIMTLPIKK